MMGMKGRGEGRGPEGGCGYFTFVSDSERGNEYVLENVPERGWSSLTSCQDKELRPLTPARLKLEATILTSLFPGYCFPTFLSSPLPVRDQLTEKGARGVTISR